MVQADRMRKLAIVCGPTATGKTAFSVALAEAIGGEVVSADSVSIYRGLDIGSAKPTAEEMKGIPHHMIDVLSPREPFSVSDYERLSMKAIDEIYARGHFPILCGGTGFYIRSVVYSLSYGGTPENPQIRAKYAAMEREKGKDAVYEVLKKVDPETAAKLHPNDSMRVIRAIEIFESTGRKKSEIRDEMKPRFDAFAVMLVFPREELYRRIDSRVDDMIARGLFDEVRELLSGGVPETAQSMQAIGYKETIEGIKSGDMHAAAEKIKQNSRRYAKRQITFFKAFPGLVSYSGDSAEERSAIISKMKEFMLNN